MIDLDGFCLRFAIAPAAARAALATEGDHDTPWYAQAVLGAGGWVSAIAILVFVITFLALVIGLDEPGWEAVIAGLILFGAGTAWIARHQPGLFGLHFAIAMTAAGAGLATGGTGFLTESIWAAAAIATVLAVVGTLFARSLILQFLLVALAMLLAVFALEDQFDRGAIDPLALAAPIGLALTVRPPRFDLRPLAAVLLLAMPFAAAVLEVPGPSTASPEGWPARIIYLAMFLGLIGLSMKREGERPGPAAIGAALLAALVCLLLPAGAAAALFLMMLAYAIGHRPYAAIGAGLAVWFIWQFYYALAISLLQKSILLAAVGAGCLALYGLLAVLDRGRPA